MIITDEEALRVTCVDVLPDEIGPLREQLERELKHSERMGRPGWGLAAPQIGVAKNMAIVRISRDKDYSLDLDLVNCKIAEGFDQNFFEQEGCLSFPGRFERTLRYQEIHIVNNAIGPPGFIITGVAAVVCQHEMDHLSSILLPDVAIKETEIRKKKVRPNDLCLCNSGRKYKKCCGG